MDALTALLHQIYPELLAEGFVESHKRLSMTELQAFGIEFGSHTVSSMLHGGDLWFKVSCQFTMTLTGAPFPFNTNKTQMYREI